jgi:hypothetical protein
MSGHSTTHYPNFRYFSYLDFAIKRRYYQRAFILIQLYLASGDNSMVNEPVSTPPTANGPIGHLRQEYEDHLTLFQAQPPLVQRFLEAQARPVAEAFIQRLPHVHFMLPDRVVDLAGKVELVPSEVRKQQLGSRLGWLTHTDIRATLRHHFAELENDPNRAVAASAGLLQHAVVMHMVQGMLPAGRSVTYIAAEDEEIPTIPAGGDLEPESALTQATDAIIEDNTSEDGRGDLQVPFVPAARRFYLPQWVAFDNQDKLLVGSVGEAEAHLASMQRYLNILHAAVYMAGYMVVDEEYQQKRYGMLGQFINQGRAMARYRTREIIQTIRRRAAAQSLNRGLSLSLPYLDDQDLRMKMYPFEIIPAGRIMFIPAFVIRAVREEQAKVGQDTRLSPSTRKHIIVELKMLETAFETSENEMRPQ